jgi:hypothetical protein
MLGISSIDSSSIEATHATKQLPYVNLVPSAKNNENLVWFVGFIIMC